MIQMDGQRNEFHCFASKPCNVVVEIGRMEESAAILRMPMKLYLRLRLPIKLAQITANIQLASKPPCHRIGK
jgi:hypothetical protein